MQAKIQISIEGLTEKIWKAATFLEQHLFTLNILLKCHFHKLKMISGLQITRRISNHLMLLNTGRASPIKVKKERFSETFIIF